MDRRQILLGLLRLAQQQQQAQQEVKTQAQEEEGPPASISLEVLQRRTEEHENSEDPEERAHRRFSRLRHWRRKEGRENEENRQKAQREGDNLELQKLVNNRYQTMKKLALDCRRDPDRLVILLAFIGGIEDAFHAAVRESKEPEINAEVETVGSFELLCMKRPTGGTDVAIYTTGLAARLAPSDLALDEDLIRMFDKDSLAAGVPDVALQRLRESLRLLS